ncbi:choice-of-anchor X domain-containing protein [Melioribacter sp. Ez-97]|uniref:choice-of-anchor X domain-containing protein n=1 Tax=Melioribacter sp. Ez-97 TaxID=3423434 RepID=UPI003ED9FF49
MIFSFFRFKRHLFVIFLLALIAACKDELPTGVIDSPSDNVVVKKIIASERFSYSQSDSLYLFRVEINDSKNVLEFWLRLRLADGSETFIDQLPLKDDGDLSNSGDNIAGDGIYSALLPMSKQFPSDKYVIEGFVLEKNDPSSETRKVFSHYLDYTNESENYPPEIIEITAPSSGNVNQRITLSVRVSDPNGLSDITEVYYELYRPDGTQVKNSQGVTKFPMFDDGNSGINGDTTADDGIYTVFLTFPEGQPSGKWRFVFSARDRSGAVSNPVEFDFTLN